MSNKKDKNPISKKKPKDIPYEKPMYEDFQVSNYKSNGGKIKMDAQYKSAGGTIFKGR